MYEETSWDETIGSSLKKFKMTAEEVAVVHFHEKFSKKVAKIHSSFESKIPKFHCLSTDDKEAICCQAMGRPQPRFCVVLSKYQTRSNGKLLAQPVDPGLVYFIDLPLTKRNKIQRAKGEESLDSMDFELTCINEKLQDWDIKAQDDCVFHEKSNASDKEETMDNVKIIHDEIETNAFVRYSEAKLRSVLVDKGLLEGEPSSGAGGFSASDEEVTEEATSTKGSASSPKVKAETSNEPVAEASSSEEDDLKKFLEN